VFDLRYHVASLAAVFIALIIGILVGVGLAGSGVTSKVDLRLEKRRNADLRATLGQVTAQRDAATRTQKAFQLAYPALMAGRLSGMNVAVLFVGKIDGSVRGDIERTLSDAGAGQPARIRALKVPINADAIDKVLFAHAAYVKYGGSDKLGALGRALAHEFTLGGATPLWALLSSELVEERIGPAKQRADAVIVVRTVNPQQDGTARFLTGLLGGLGTGGAPVVGVEETEAQQSAVPAFNTRGLSSVDDVDQPVGRLALALLLSGAAPGQYGVKDAASAVLPPVEPLTITTK
jgi:Copper transport outer membrane protein, MctB